MAKFDASGCPSDFLARIRKFEVDIEDKQNLIAREKQLITDLEQQKAEKEKATKELETENANLGSNIEHLHALHIKQQQDTERSIETRELLKEQVKVQTEKLEALKARNQRTKDKCENIYKEYMSKYLERMQFYDTLPYVQEYKEKLLELEEISKTLKERKEEEMLLKDEIKLLQEKKDALQPQFTLTEWGVRLAELYRRAGKINLENVCKNISFLEKNVAMLVEKKKNLDEEKSRRVSKTAEQASSQKSKSFFNPKPVEPTEHLPFASQSKPTTSKQYSVPDFRSFFKGFSSYHKRGASGSSLTSTKPCTYPKFSSSLPSAESNKEVAAQVVSLTGSCQSVDDVSNDFVKPSLSTLLPQNKVSTGEESSEKANFAKEDVAKDSSSWSVPTISCGRITEKPLLRQVQEKMLQIKFGQEKEEPATVTEEQKQLSAEETDGQPASIDEEAVEDATVLEKQTNLLTLYDGSTYDVPMATEEETNSEINIKSPVRFSMEEHRKMMAEIAKSPEDYFRFQSNVVPMEGADGTYLLSPPELDTASSSESVNRPLRKGDFQFAVPTEPPPGHSKRGLASAEFFGTTENVSAPKQTESPVVFQGFSFGQDVEDLSTTSSEFNFNSDNTADNSETSAVLFSFGNKNDISPTKQVVSTGLFAFETNQVQSPPNFDREMFSFKGGQATSPEEYTSGLFSASTEKEETQASSFASLFGPSK